VIASLALIASLAACNPIDTVRSWTGSAKNDPDPATTPNTANLAAGEAAPYPNLASVPSPPIPALTQAERDKLTQSLIADRANARYNGEKLQPGIPAGAEAPPPPPPMAENPAPKPGATPPKAAAAAPGSGAAKPVGAAPPRKPGEPAAPGPQESSLQVPQIPEKPQPEAPRPTPAAPQVTPAPAPAAAPLNPAAAATASPRPPPPPPTMPQPPPAPAVPASVRIVPTPAAATVATISFAATSMALAAPDRASIARVVALYRQAPRSIRIVAYAPEASDGNQQLANYRIALGRAQAVAKALAEAGIPVAKIATEAAPSPPNGPSGRVDIQLVT
jgi:outer membrane protein OmpA-like peptidoglycan-associated protein